MFYLRTKAQFSASQLNFHLIICMISPSLNFSPCCSYQTALHRAVLVDSLEITELLLSRGAELNPGDRDGVTPLALANRYTGLDIEVALVPLLMHMLFLDFSTDKRAIANILRKAGGSTTASTVTSVDLNLRHDPMFSHPPPWAEVEKIYAAVMSKAEKPEPGAFNVKKFDFKLFDNKSQPTKEVQQPQMSSPKQKPVNVKQKSPSPVKSSNFFNKKSNQFKNVNDHHSVARNNDAQDSVKYTINNKATESAQFSKVSEDSRDAPENIYDVPKSCDTIQVVAEDHVTEAEVENKENKLLDKIRSTSSKLQKNTQEKSKQLKNKVGAYISSKSKSKVAPPSETNDGPNAENKSGLKKFVNKVQASSVKQTTTFKSINVKKVNFPKLKISVNDIRVKLRKSSGDKSGPNETKKPKTLNITNAGNTETYTAAPVNDDIDFKAIKKRIDDFPRTLKNKLFPKKRNGQIKETDEKNKVFKDLKTTFSGLNPSNLKAKFNNKRSNTDNKETKFLNDVKTDKFQFLRPKKKSDNIDNNSRKFLGKFNISEKWSAVRSGKPKESTKTDKKLKSPQSTTKEGRRTHFSDETDGRNLRPGSSNYNPRVKPFNADYNFPNGDTHKFKWQFVDGQWRKSGTAGL